MDCTAELDLDLRPPARTCTMRNIMNLMAGSALKDRLCQGTIRKW